MVGEYKSNPNKDNHEQIFLDLAQYAREVFRTQNRRFMLEFTLCGLMLRLWQFDRSGISGSTSFDINKHEYQFVHGMLGYYPMNDKKLGFDPTIHRVDGKHWIDIIRNGQIERLFVEGEVRKYPAIIDHTTSY